MTLSRRWIYSTKQKWLTAALLSCLHRVDGDVTHLAVTHSTLEDDLVAVVVDLEWTLLPGVALVTRDPEQGGFCVIFIVQLVSENRNITCYSLNKNYWFHANANM